MSQSKAKEAVIKQEEQRRAQAEQQPQEEQKCAQAEQQPSQEEGQQASGDKRPDSSETYSRLKQNPLGEILKDYLPWISASSLFTPEQKKAAEMIAICKTEALGGFLNYCENCDEYVDFHYRSCNNRNCPNCQYPMQERWIEMRKNEVIPGIPYYHIILTYPHELNPLFQSNEKLLLGLLMRTSSRSVITMCEDPKVLGAVPSVLNVVHTWSSDLQLHFHSHMLVSGAGLDREGRLIKLTDLRAQQKQARKDAGAGSADDTAPESSGTSEGNDYFLPMTALTALFRDAFMANLRKLYSSHSLTIPADHPELHDPVVWSNFCYKLEQMDWVGDLEKTTAQGENVIEYFARYSYRTAISNSRIVSYDGEKVQFTVRDKNAPNGKRVLSLDAHTFICRYLSHVLPKGFTRVRSFGILSNAQKTKKLVSIHEQLNIAPYVRSPFRNLRGMALLMALFPDREWGVCPHCHGILIPVPIQKGMCPEEMVRPRQRKMSA